MARKTSITVRCDGDGCRHFEDVENDSTTPEGWITVGIADVTGRVQKGKGFDLCSLACVGKWAKARREALGETAAREPRPKVKCEYCDAMCAPQGMGLHVRTTHPEEFELEQATAPD